VSDADDAGDRRRSLPEEATQLVEAVRAWSADPAVRAQLATAATSLLEAGAALLDTVAERQRARESRPEPPRAPGRPAAPSEDSAPED
jgi:hypothetical protein